ncbi:MAG: EAL domain-containing protein [Alphaproteobacteria bacterium]|nr:EAL domain-containing protein [Alphaproteobacteria bacterium]HJM93522.1 EAL domain-containing protein [Alphaproteobacteria bacterium]
MSMATVSLKKNTDSMSATDPSTLDHLLSLMHIHSSIADRPIFEITDTAAMMDFEETTRFANKLRDLGCRIALDDFGTGYTSYQHLKAPSVDIVKIDGQFVKDLHENKENQLFVQTLLDLADGFNAEVVGECVETKEEAQALRDRGVKYLQGYHFGAPIVERPWGTPNLRMVACD